MTIYVLAYLVAFLCAGAAAVVSPYSTRLLAASGVIGFGALLIQSMVR